jgi:cellulose synthase/poly-beta-1,6-N-acetylglucosamine synthase-like glycosyltransferase/peptidoglycan/xylan/chitin deacetylase (PgdA/CDA1 family)
MARAQAVRPRGREDSGSWGHWVLLILALAGIGFALVIERQLAAGAGPDPAAAVRAAATLRSPVLVANRRHQLTAVPLEPGTASLVFSGGSGRSWQRQIVSELARLNIPATFLLTAGAPAAAPGLLGQEHADGDDVGIAGSAMAAGPGWLLDAQLARAQHAVLGAGQPATALVSPPGGTTLRAMTARTWRAARSLADAGYVVVLADRSAVGARSPAAVLDATLTLGSSLNSAGPTTPPSVVVELPAAGPGGAATLAALPRLTAGLWSEGYRYATITSAGQLRIAPARLTALTAIGATALLAAVRLAGFLTTAVGWAFLAAVMIVASRCFLLIGTGCWHRSRERREPRRWHGPVSVIVPAYNEAAGIERCLRSMVGSDYADALEVILVDDGSSDGTADLAAALGLPVTIVRQANAGKAAALNAGIRQAAHQVLVTIAALVGPLRDPLVGAVAGNVKVSSRRRLLGLIQHCDYVLASSLDRRMYDVLDCMLTIPGAAGAFRRTAIAEAGGVPTQTLAEDTDLTIAIGRAGWRIRYAPQARAWTEAPATIRQLWSQRHRWTYGMLQVLWKYRSMLVTPRSNRTLAWIGLPYLFAMGCLLPLVSPMADLYILLEAWVSPWHAARIWLGFLLLQTVLTACAFILDSERLDELWTIPVQLMFYRQFMYLVMIHSMATALTGVRLRWHKLTRIGVEVGQT